jgi:hypothetical protein
MKTEYVYLCRASNGLVKIGKSTNIKQRIYHLHTASPWDLEFIFAIENDGKTNLEREIQLMYKDKLQRYEWFSLSGRDLEDILVWCSENDKKVVLADGSTPEVCEHCGSIIGFLL